MAEYGTRTLVVSVIALVVVVACTRREASRSGPMRQLKKSEMTAAEIKYGIAPVPDASVTYRPNVIIVGGGAEAFAPSVRPV